MEESASFPRPSLFIASRLASIVHKFKHRLQERVERKKKSPNPFGVTYQRGIRLRALSDLQRCAPPCRLRVSEEPRSAIEHQGHGRWINELLCDLSTHTDASNSSLARIAADDKLFLSPAHDSLIEAIVQHATVPQAAYMFDCSTFLISRLETLLSHKAKQWAESDADCKRLKDEAYIANLLHLLRRLQYLLFQVLVHRSITRLDEFALHWQTYWQQQKKLGEDWFTEWPSGHRPLSTTWPWNIRPSLIVLWGVCWQFYSPEPNNQDHSRSPAQQLVDGSLSWMPSFPIEDPEQVRRVRLGIDTVTIARTMDQMQAPQTRSNSSPNVQAAMMGQDLDQVSGQSLSAGAIPAQPQDYCLVQGRYGLFPCYSHDGESQPQGHQPTTPPAVQPFALGTHDNSIHLVVINLDESFDQALIALGISSQSFHEAGQGVEPNHLLPSASYVHQPPLYLSPHQSRDLSTWPNSTSGDLQSTYASREQFHPNVWTGYNIQGPYHHPPQIPTFQVSAAEEPSFVSQIETPGAQAVYQPHLQAPFGENQDMGGVSGYPPSPDSDGGRPPSDTTPASMPRSLNPGHPSTPSSVGSKAAHVSVKRGEPPRDASNQICCVHPDCADEVPTFRRPCEWNKHMDKHDRPYKCLEPGCDKIQGFTYSGGLLRHQREVHKKNKSPQQELHCPFPNCNRSTETPFTRQENLKEHIRRRHVNEGAMTSPGALSAVMASNTPARPEQPLRKRKRLSSTNLDEAESRDGSDEEDPFDHIKRLKSEIVEKDSKIRRLEAQVAKYKQQHSSLGLRAGS